MLTKGDILEIKGVAISFITIGVNNSMSIDSQVCKLSKQRIDQYSSFQYLRTKLKIESLCLAQKDFERLQLLYKTEGEPKGGSSTRSALATYIDLIENKYNLKRI